jgi:hypothetical protein
VEAKVKARNVRVVSAFLATLLIAPVLRADEDTPPLLPGQRVRVTAAAPGHFIGVAMGSLVKIGPDSLTLLDPERSTVTELSLDSITRVEVSRGKHGHTWQGALIGAGFGSLGAVAIAADSSGLCGSVDLPRSCSSSEKVAWGVAVVGLWAGIGAWVGHRKQSEDWGSSTVERLRVALRPERGGGRVALTLAF